ncbi:MAG: hypothetical protein NC094_02315 [Bacteroidales bacterium]|nr:hypothetical protein [Lachnoclostridium sp.]MCM1383384.1 hypothetical protein [Lachnoclostridium sp.]MCM1464232.1 hypothetical protein [Bacteroidales bacterium]
MNYVIRNLTVEETAEIYKGWIPKHFPKDEIKPLKHICRMWEQGAYCALGMYNGEKLVSYGFFAMAPGKDMLLLDYFAVLEDYRNLGAGSFFLKKMGQCLTEQMGVLYQGILIETEDIAYARSDEERQIRRKRDLFYEKNGAVRTGVVSEVYGVHYVIWNLPIAGNMGTGECREQLKAIYRMMVEGDKYQRFVKII